MQYLDSLGYRHDHSLLTLRRPNYPPALVRARQAGITIYQAPDVQAVHSLIEDSDLVELHYWHCPAFVEFLAGQWPPHRRLAWFKILGRHAPQVISPDLLGALDAVMLSSGLSLELQAINQAGHLRGMIEVVPGLMEPERLEGLMPEAHEGFVVSYVGTANATKMHPDFVAMSARADIPDARFLVCGSGDPAPLQAEAQRLHAPGKFEFRGYVENIRPVLAITDVFGYPLCEDTWATSEKSLQEAMLAGIPPVVFPHGGIASIVSHDDTGLVVQSAGEYAQALEYLHRNPQERKRLGDNARSFIQQQFDGRTVAGQIESLHQRLLQQPPREIPAVLPTLSAAQRFARYMLPVDERFEASLNAQDWRQAMAADCELAASSMPTASGEGGIVQFRNAYPNDPDLLGWSGLIQAGLGRWQQALSEFACALSLRPDHWRHSWYQAVAHCHVNDRASAQDMISNTLSLAVAAGVDRTGLERIEIESDQELPKLFVQ